MSGHLSVSPLYISLMTTTRLLVDTFLQKRGGSELKKLIRRVFCYRETDHARGNVCTVTSSPCTAECTSVHSLYTLLSSGQSIADNPQVNTDMCDNLEINGEVVE